jgi:methylglutaconyl-CoA hydratase
MTKQKVTVEQDSRGVATVTLDNPEKHNAFDDSIIAELTAAFERIGSDDRARVMILAATGRNFCAGADLGWMKRMVSYSYEENLEDARHLATMLKTLNFLPLPTIARVQGAAFGGAVGLVSCCDMAVATEGASFCLSEVKIGITPATISPYVVAAIGRKAARRYFTTAERFSAPTAAHLGLVSEVVEEDRLDEQLEKLVEALLSNSPRAVSAAKQLVLDVAGREINQRLIDETSERIARIRVSPEGQEGLTAFLEKRKPAWSV